MSQETEVGKHKDRLSKLPIEDIRKLYRKLVQGRSGLLTPPTAEELAAAELLDEDRRRQQLTAFSTSALQAIVVREKPSDETEETVDYRLALEILSERNPVPLKYSLSE